MSALDGGRYPLDELRDGLAAHGVDALVLRPSADFRYLTGGAWGAGWTCGLSQATFLVVTPDGPPVLVGDVAGAKAAWGAELPALKLLAADGNPAVYAALGSLVDPMQRVGVDPAMPARELLALQEQLGPSTLLASAAPLMAQLRLRKSATEIDALERAAVAADRVLVAARDLTWSGHTEREMAARLRALLAEAGHEEVMFLGVAAGENSADPWRLPTDRVINPGDAVAVEVTGRQAGYCSHTARMFVVSEPPEDFEALYSVVLAAQRAACEAVRPGIAAAEIDAVAREVIADSGYGAFAARRTGYGIGLEEDEPPCLVADDPTIIEAGMTVSIGPGIYLPELYGARIGDVVVCTEMGARRLNQTPRLLDVVDL